MNTPAKPQPSNVAEMRATLMRTTSRISDCLNLLALASEKMHGNPDVADALVSAVSEWLDKTYFSIEEVVAGLSGDSAKGEGNG